ncbi:hypothetical protein T484DRAFT_1784319 [Baffinella frigidus]|nr:hypothetical protein T484DRAFT_1784319 [Cryptophyta sp. CCMP2293]
MDATYYGADTGNIEMQMISQQAGDKMEDLKAAFALAFPDMSMAPPVNSPWPNLYCYPPSMECLRLGVKDNLCGHCSDLGGGNFRLTNAQAGLRWGGNTFDDNNLHTGSQQVKNICTLAKFGNGGTISIRANGRCRAKSLGWGHDEVHWFANCQEGSASDAACCTNSMELQNGFNWAGFSTGNRCGGDSDADYATEWADCYFG